MPIDASTQQAFIHIPKCGGTTIESRYNLQRKECFFEGKYDAYTIDGITFAPQHLIPKHLSDLIPNWSDYNSFCFVRNPAQKMVSEYFQLHTHFYQKPKRYFLESEFRRWLKEDASQFKMDHTLPQWFYAEDCDHIFRLQDLTQTIPLLDKWFNFGKSIPLQNKKKGGQHWTLRGKRNNNDISKHLSRKTRSLIERIYQVDYDYLNQYF